MSHVGNQEKMNKSIICHDIYVIGPTLKQSPKSKTKETLERTGLREQGKGQFKGLWIHCTILYKEVKSKATSYLQGLTL